MGAGGVIQNTDNHTFHDVKVGKTIWLSVPQSTPREDLILFYSPILDKIMVVRRKRVESR